MSPAIKLLGSVELRRADGVVADASAVPTTKAMDLLRLLVAAGGQQRAAEQYIELLWPTADEARGRMSMRTAVAQLRRVLGPDAVHRSGDLLQLGEIDSDVARLRRGAAAVERHRKLGHDAELLRLVHDLEESSGGDLVVAGGSCEAVYALRAELREVRGQVLLAGAGAAARLTLARESLDLALRADGLLGSEASARAVMVAWSSLGETRRAIEVFEHLCVSLENAYGVQPSPETRALYLQVVTAGDGLTLRPAEHHRDVVVDLATTVVDLVGVLEEDAEPEGGRRRGGVIWLHGEPGAGRGVVAREAVRLLEQARPDAVERVLILPEVIALDDLERQRLRREAIAEGLVLVVPVRAPESSTSSEIETSMTVQALDREEFRDLLTQLLQERPSRVLEERLWCTTGGLAGHAVRTVGELMRLGQLRWSPGEVGLPPRVRRHRTSGSSIQTASLPGA